MPTPPPRFRHDVQGLRALAVVAVVAFHAGVALPGGFVGVDVFFVVSGFVITRVLRHELETTGRIELWTFALRRVRRLLPPLAALLTIVVPLSLLLGPIDAQAVGLRTGIAASLFNANTYLSMVGDDYFATSTELNPLLHMWSLSVEEQFYIVLPTALLVCWNVATRLGVNGVRALRWMLGVGSAASLAFAELLASGRFRSTIPLRFEDLRIDESFAFYSAPTRAWEFAVGSLLALGVGERIVATRTRARLVEAFGCAGLGATLLTYNDHMVFPGVSAVLPVVCTAALLLAGGATNDSLPQRLLALPVMQRLGGVSYSWYLWHWPAIVFANATLTGSRYDTALTPLVFGVASLIPAVVSMRLVENPFRRRQRSSARTVALGFTCIAAPVVVAGATLFVGQALLAERLEPFESAFTNSHIQRGCGEVAGAEVDDFVLCSFGDDLELASDAMLLGDSNAAHFSEGFVDGMLAAGVEPHLAAMGGCPFVDVELIRLGGHVENCSAFVDRFTDQAVKLQPDLVILSNAIDRYLRKDSVGLRDPSSGKIANSATSKAETYQLGQERTIARLQDAGIEVVVVRPVPRFLDWTPGECSLIRWDQDPRACGAEVSRDEVEGQRELAMSTESRLASQGVRVVDFIDRFCDVDACVTHEDSTWWFRDGGHLSIDASKVLADTFKAVPSDP